MILRPRATAALAAMVLGLSSTAAFAQKAPAPDAPAAAAAATKGVAVGEPAPSGKPSGPRSSAEETGLAAVYSDKLNGRKTASGKKYNRNALTAAHKTLPFGTKVRVTNNKNKKSVVLTINDRGPAQAERILDISPRAANALGIHRRGMGDVTMVVMSR